VEVLEIRQLLSGPTALQVAPGSASTSVNQPITLTAAFTDTDQGATLSDTWTINGPNGTTTVNHTPTLQSGTWTDSFQLTPTTAGSYSIGFMTHDMTGHYATSGATVTAAAPTPPAVTGLSLTSGSTAGGASIVIGGSGFSNVSSVTFGTVTATYVVNSSTQLTVTTPVEAAGTIDVRVTNSVGTSGITTSDKFTFVSPPPTVTGLSVTQGSTSGGDSLVVSGSNFTGATAVYVGGVASQFTVTSATAISVTTPAHSVGTGDVVVVGPGGSSATSAADRYTYLMPTPVVTGLSVQSGPAVGGTAIAITGSNFGGAVVVSFGGIGVMGFTVNSAGTSISVVTPADVAGVADVRVTTIGGTSAISTADQFNFIGPPTITALDIAQGPTSGGTTVKLSGANLNQATAVFFGSVAAQSFVINQDGTISAVAPGVASSVPLMRDISVVTPSGASATGSADQFTYYPPPAVMSLSRSSGPAAGGGQIVVSGSNLSAATQVNVGGVASPFVVNLDGTLTVTLPAASAVGQVSNQPLTADLTVSTPWGTSSTGVADQYTFVPPPVITALDTSVGSAAGGGTVTISGSALSGAVAVYVGTVSTTFTTNADGTLSALIPSVAGSGPAPQTLDVTVVTAGGVSAIGSADELTLYPPPVISGLDTTSGSDQGGMVVTVSGTGLSAATAVFVGTIQSTFTVNQDGTLSVDVPAGADGTVNITVVSPGGASLSGTTNQFTYLLDTSAEDAGLAAGDQAAVSTAVQADTTAANTEGTGDQSAADALVAASNTASGTQGTNDGTALNNFNSAGQGAESTLESSDQTAEDAVNTADQTAEDAQNSGDQTAEDTFNSNETGDAATQAGSDTAAGALLSDAEQTATNAEQSTAATASQVLANATAAAQQQYDTSVAAAQDAYNTAVASGTAIMGTFDPTTGTVVPLPPYDPSQDPGYQSATQAADATYGTAVATAQQQYQDALSTAAAAYQIATQPALDTYNLAVAGDQAEEQQAVDAASAADAATQTADAAGDQAAVQSDGQTLAGALQSDENTYEAAVSTAQAIYAATIAADQATFDGQKTAADATLAQVQSNDQTAYDIDIATAQATYDAAVAQAQAGYDTVANNQNSTANDIAQAGAANLTAQATAGGQLLNDKATAHATRDGRDAAAGDDWSHTMDAAASAQAQADALASNTLAQALDAAAAAQVQQDGQAEVADVEADDAAAESESEGDAIAANNEILADDAAAAKELQKDATAAGQAVQANDPAYIALAEANAQAQDNLNIAMATALAAQQDAYAAALAAGTAAWAAGQPGNPAATLQAAIASANATRTMAVDAAQVAYATTTGNADAKWYTDVGPAATAYLDTLSGDAVTFLNSEASDTQKQLDTEANDALTAITTLIPQVQKLSDTLAKDDAAWMNAVAGQVQQLADTMAADGLAAVDAVAPQLQKLGDALADNAKSDTVAAGAVRVTLATNIGINMLTWATAVGTALKNAAPAKMPAPIIADNVELSDKQKEVIVQASKSMKDLDANERELRTITVTAAMKNQFLTADGLPLGGQRRPQYWQLVRDQYGALAYAAKGAAGVMTALRSVFTPVGGLNRQQYAMCREMCELITIAALAEFYIRNGNAKGVQWVADTMGGHATGDIIGPFIKQVANPDNFPKGIPIAMLKPGDRVWVENPFYNIYLDPKKKDPLTGKNLPFAGEGGHNAIYLGLDKVTKEPLFSLYGGSIQTLNDIIKDMMDPDQEWHSIQAAIDDATALGKTIDPSVFVIGGAYAPIVPAAP